MSKFFWIITLVLVLIAGIVVYNKVIKPKESAPKTGGAAKVLEIQGFVAKPKSIDNNIEAPGTLLAYEDVELHPEVSGKIIELNLQEGTFVKQGTLLVKLFDADLQAQLKKLQAQKETAEKTVQRLKQLLAINGIGQQDYDNATTQLDGINADIDYTNALITKTEIRAPFDGVIGLKNVSQGAYVSPTTIVATMQQVNRLKMDFTIPEKYSSILKKGDEVQFTVDGVSDTFKGNVYAIEPRIDESTRTVKARAVVSNTNAKLYPGAFARVNIGLTSTKDALMVPTQCIIPDARLQKLAVFNSGVVNIRTVQTGVRNESEIQITNGIAAGDTIISTGIMYVRPAMQVKLTKLVQ